MVRGCAVLHRGLGGSAVSGPDAGDLSSALAKELRNFQEIAHWLMPEPGEVPRLRRFIASGRRARAARS